MLSKFKDLLQAKQRHRIVVTTPDYYQIEILWGLFSLEKGEKREFLIEGGPEFCAAVLQSLRSDAKILKLLEQ
ncbi:MAG: hypothetical protein CVU65_00195 [Deltaproteobacteria bacterium HGW-Deltaproteobacteria-22]|nr:MAG: hypothetical protein CVU65_00195 [Deltaproteobacteria bacterium HGW-Deltaproteobacteria-22]